MANGNFAGGDGSLANPFLIEDAHDLNVVRNGLDKHYKLVKNINLDIEPYNQGDGWEPISKFWDDATRFRGVIDGDGHFIVGLYSKINGLIGHTINAQIRNLNLINVHVEGSHPYLGGLLGHTRNTVIEKCNISGVVDGRSKTEISESDLGGLVARVHNGGTLKNCKSSCKVYTNRHTYVGALVGAVIDSTITDCVSIGNIKLRGVQTRGSSARLFWDMSLYGGNDGGLTTTQMQNTQTFIDVGWDNILNNDESNVWILEEGKYPELWFEKLVKLKRYLFQCGNNIMKPTENGLSKIGDMPATSQMFDDYGTDDLSDIIGKVDKAFEMKYKEDLEDRKLYRYKLIGFKDICILRNVKETIIDPDIELGTQLLNPLDGYERYYANHSNFSYTGTWDISGANNNYKTTTTPNSTATFMVPKDGDLLLLGNVRYSFRPSKIEVLVNGVLDGRFSQVYSDAIDNGRSLSVWAMVKNMKVGDKVKIVPYGLTSNVLFSLHAIDIGGKFRNLIYKDNKYYIYQDNEFIEVEPTIENFEKYGIDLLDIVTTPTDKVRTTMEAKGDLGDGREFSKVFDMTEFKKQFRNIKKINEV